MKPKLPCCEINKNYPSISKPTIPKLFPEKTVECDHCQCVFEKKEQLDDHIREIHEVQFTGKRKLRCCERNENKRSRKEHRPTAHRGWKISNKQLKKEQRHHECYYCECEFQKKHELKNHMRNVHQCKTCGQIVLTEEIRAQHQIKHEEEQRKKQELENKQKERDEDLVLNYLLKNKIDEYQPDPDYEPDYDIIFHTYGKRMGKEQLLKFVKKFEHANPLCHYEDYTFTFDQIIYLLENGGVSVEDVAGLIDYLTYSLGDDKITSELVAYFLNKGYEIKREWVAKAIKDDALMERIKEKYTYTFDEVYKAREEDSFFDSRARDEFYVQVHKHFPDPDFEDPFADPFIDFERVSTEHVHDHLQNRYFYDEEDDDLSIVIGWGDERQDISLGSCEGLLNMNLQDLIERYNKATAEYDKANDTVSELFKKREEELDAASTEKEREDIRDHYYYEIYKDGALSERNHIANEVSKLYFVIAQK